ncbi:hypothetical protein PYCC9005_000728 [Savitreella phatthalungensis]
MLGRHCKYLSRHVSGKAYVSSTATDSFDVGKFARLIIAGRVCDSQQTFEVRGADDTVVSGAYDTDAGQAESAAFACSIAQHAWSQQSLHHRKEFLRKALSLLISRRDELATIAREELGGSPEWLNFDVTVLATGSLRGLLDTADAALAPTRIEREDGGISIVTRHPHGVCLAVAPWNAPFVLTARAIATPLLAGNACVLKTSERSPRTQLALAQVFLDAGLPADLLAVLHSSRAAAPHLISRLVASDNIQHVNFTGGFVAGSKIAAACGRAMKPCLMELGGKACAIVLEDADIDTAVNQILVGTLLHAGQICMSTERVIFVGTNIAFEDFCRKISLAAKHHPLALHVKPLALGVRSSDLKTLISEAISAGARNVLDHDAHASHSSRTLAPNFLRDVPTSCKINKEETFGPVCLLEHIDSARVPAGDLHNQIVDRVNSGNSGLTVSIFSSSLPEADQKLMIDVYDGHALQLARRLNTAAIHFNKMTVGDDGRVPHGGFRLSGFGRFNGLEGLRSFSQTKTWNFPARCVPP